MSPENNTFLQVFVTFPDRDSAMSAARRLVEDALAGCVQIVGPIHSVYKWKGTIETAEEWLCLVKTAAHHFPELEKRLREMHPYDVPEIIAVSICKGSASYLSWLSEVLKDTSANNS